MLHQHRVFARMAEPRGKRHGGGQRRHRGLRQAFEERRLEQSRQDRVHAHAVAREVAGDRQRHADDAALGCGIGRLPDLPVLCGDGGRVDDEPALAVRVAVRRLHRVELHHRGRCVGDAVERSDEVDGDRALEKSQIVHGDRTRLAVARNRLLRRADARAVDEDARGPVRLCGSGKAAGDRGRIGHVHLRADAADLVGDGASAFLVHVEQGDAHAMAREHARGRLAETGRAAGDDGRDGGIELHGGSPVWFTRAGTRARRPRFPSRAELEAAPCRSARSRRS